MAVSSTGEESQLRLSSANQLSVPTRRDFLTLRVRYGFGVMSSLPVQLLGLPPVAASPASVPDCARVR